RRHTRSDRDWSSDVCSSDLRGPKAKGAIRAAGLVESWSPSSEAVAEMLAHVLATDIRGRRIAVQLHGEPLPHVVSALQDAGATRSEERRVGKEGRDRWATVG